ncbi:MAG TPA: cytochrome ubiquinol oxidase subunit I [Gaiellaceae bacterium]|nr:cytochrome ubiquinol oxidase subunit I [Gaiellaceae bacterium]
MALDLARWQFAVTTLYHFLFVPVTIGMAWFVAGMQTLWHISGKERYLRMTRFFGKLFLINFALGVVTGIVQEFQFGMNWSVYSRYVGDVFGAPLAIEGLAAFFLESTFLGLWIFGWDRLRRGVHLATIWLVALGTTASAYFILAANAWMQHPVGYRLVDGHAEMTSLEQVFFQSLQITEFSHVIVVALLTAAFLVLAVSAYWLRQGREVEMFRSASRGALAVSLVASGLVIVVGHFQGQILEREQPMKMAASEALYHTSKPAGLSLLAVAPWERRPKRTSVDVVFPHLLSILATSSWNGKVEGIDEVQAAEVKKYGPGNYMPIIGAIYWEWRVMAGIGVLAFLFSALGLWFVRGGRGLDRARRFSWWTYVFLALPFLASSAGWLFTEMGRQPWIVYGLLRTSQAVSPRNSVFDVGLTLGVFAATYAVLAGVEGWLMVRAVKAGPEDEFPQVIPEDAALPPLVY